MTLTQQRKESEQKYLLSPFKSAPSSVEYPAGQVNGTEILFVANIADEIKAAWEGDCAKNFITTF